MCVGGGSRDVKAQSAAQPHSHTTARRHQHATKERTRTPTRTHTRTYTYNCNAGSHTHTHTTQPRRDETSIDRHHRRQQGVFNTHTSTHSITHPRPHTYIHIHTYTHTHTTYILTNLSNLLRSLQLRPCRRSWNLNVRNTHVRCHEFVFEPSLIRLQMPDTESECESTGRVRLGNIPTSGAA